MERPRTRTASLFWRVFGLNALVFIVAGLLLALSPLTVSSPITLGQATTLVAGIALMLLIDLALLRRSMAPLGELASTMRRIDPLRPGQRVPLVPRDRELCELVASFNEMLDRLEAERRASAHREAQATDAEQRRIAAELHDEIGQRLTVLLLMLANAEADADPEIRRRLRAARRLTHEIVEDLRDVVVRLRPPVLDELGLANALTALTRTIEQQAATPVRARVAQVEGELSPVASLVVYRIAQEALTNAVRHAGGSAIELALTQDDDQVCLQVADQGPGLGDGDPQRRGSGLRSMAERALLVGGALRIDSTPGGTVIHLTVPVGEHP
jgi:two-component system, NarL family, sensor histidine kinase UhpB